MPDEYKTPPLAQEQDQKVLAANLLKQQRDNARLRKLLEEVALADEKRSQQIRTALLLEENDE
jgi:hypothetical protein